MRRHLDIDPVRGAEDEGRIDLCDLDDAGGAGNGEVDRLTGLFTQPLQSGIGGGHQSFNPVKTRRVSGEQRPAAIEPVPVTFDEPVAFEGGEQA